MSAVEDEVRCMRPIEAWFTIDSRAGIIML